MTITAGIDVGSSSVKTAIFRVEGEEEALLASRLDRLLRRNPLAVAEEGFQAALATAGAISRIRRRSNGLGIRYSGPNFRSAPP